MDHIDQFASMFKRAERLPFHYDTPQVKSAVLVTDESVEGAEILQKQISRFLPILKSFEKWEIVSGSDFSTVAELVERLESFAPDLIVTQRNLHERGLVPQHSLGVYVDVLTQVLDAPVLLLPAAANGDVQIPKRESRNTMIVTDHVAGQTRLISYGTAFGAGEGEIWICHVEDDRVFERYLRAIERIPEIDTEEARKLIQLQLFNEASDFIQAAIENLKEQFPQQRFHASVSKGHRLKQYLHLVHSHAVELLVFNTKDEDQMAMHGMAYALSVEVAHIPLILL